MKISQSVFVVNNSFTIWKNTHGTSLCRDYMEAMWNLIQTPGLGNFSGEQRRHALYAALLLSFRKIVYKNNKEKLVLQFKILSHCYRSCLELPLLQFEEHKDHVSEEQVMCAVFLDPEISNP